MKIPFNVLRSGLLLAVAGLGLLHAAEEPAFTRITTGPGADKDFSYSAAWTDYDNDGYIDLFVPNGYFTSSRANLLYRNNRDGTFTRMTTNEVGSIVSDKGGWRGCGWGDYDNDGYPDLFVAQSGKRAIYHNTGTGGFTRVADGGPLAADLTHSEGALWGDYDGDGWLDVLVVSGSPGYYSRGPNWLYHNQGGGVFHKITTGPIPRDIPTSEVSLGGTWTDFDNDGDLDLVVCGGVNSRMFVYRNLGHGEFEAITTGDLPQDQCFALNLSSGDYDNDGLSDLFLADYNGTLRLFHNEGGGNFTRSLLTPSASSPQYGAWGDYDNDGHLDLFVALGESSAVKNRLYHNNGDGTFTQVMAGSAVNDVGNWGAGIWGDYDNDGFLDLFVGEDHAGGNALYHNEGNGNHWAMFKLKGTVSNALAVGAKVRIQATVGGKTFWQMREVSGGHIAQQDPRIHFGLGDATNVDLVRIEWPSGNVTEMANVAADQILSVTEFAGITPVRPSASLNGAVTLMRSGETMSRQWQFDGVDLPGQTNLKLVLTNLTAAQAGRYSVVVNTGTEVVTNHVYLIVDSQFTQVTEGPIVTDTVTSRKGSWGDYDGDGLLDLVVLGDYFNIGKNTRLYHNEGHGTFNAVTNGPWANLTDRVLYCSWADVDNDGDLDLLLAVNEADNPVFLRNDGGGTFTRFTVDKSWTSDQTQLRGYSLAWADFDRDGLLDAIISPQMLRNLGDGTFEVLTKLSTGFSTHSYQWVDYDNDGDPDLFSAGESGASLWRNDDQRVFTNVTGSILKGRLGVGLGGAFADFDADGDLDLFFIGDSNPGRFLLNNGDGTFADWTGSPKGMANVSNGAVPVWGDYDNDGNLDLYLTQAGGHGRLFRSVGDGSFVEVTVGSPVSDSTVNGKSAAWADHDNDGDLDLFIAGVSPRNHLFANNGNTNHWLKLRLKGTASNSHAIGARVYASARIAGKTVRQLRQISADSVIQELEAHFGLATATNVTTVRIEWPSGTVQELSNVAANQILTVWEPPVVKAAMQPDGACALNLRAESNRPWQIQASSDLVAWQTVATLSSATVEFEYGDTAADNMACRFYRVISP